MDNIRSFDVPQTCKPPTFPQALNWHNMLKAPVKEYLGVRKVRRALDAPELAELWDALVGTADSETAITCMPDCVDFTMPVEYAPIIRRRAGVTAAFAFCELVKQLRDLPDITDDLKVREAMTRAWREFEQRVQEANNVQEGFGCDNSQSWLTLREIGKQPDSQSLKEKMLAIANLAGRMYESFGYHRKDAPNEDPQEVIGATIGPNLDRMMSSELALLADPDCEDAQAMKILEGKATITRMAGVEAKTRGPMVIAIDESGSMHDGDLGAVYGSARRWGGRNTWAKACALALTRIAWSENRAVRIVHFGNGTQVQEMPQNDTRALFEMARSFLSGGTSFGGALKRSRAVVGDLESEGLVGADILLITDGEDWDHDSHNREIDHMDKDGVRLWTVAIGLDIDEKHPVRKRAERYTYAADRELSRPDTAVRLAQGLDKAAMGNHPPDGSMLN